MPTIASEEKRVFFDVSTIYEGHHKTTYKGIAALKCPFDYVLYQMLIWNLKPDLIIEVGTNKGGGTLYLADLLDQVGSGLVHTIDISNQVTTDLLDRHPRIKRFLQGWESYELPKGAGTVLLIEDSAHTYENTLGVLKKFAPMITESSYMIVEDGIVDELGMSAEYQGGPLRAIQEFLTGNEQFVIDRKWCDFYGRNATFNVNGYLRKIGKKPAKQQNLENAGERVEIDYHDGQVNYQLLDMYQKSHYRRYEYAASIIDQHSITGDFACGTGYGSAILSEVSTKVIGIDIDQKVVTVIRERYQHIPKIEFYPGNLLRLSYEEVFDTIVSFETIEHISKDKIGELFAVFYKALKPEGRLIFSTPYLQERSEQAIKMGFHQTFMIDENTVKQWLDEAGFMIESIKYQNYQTHLIENDLAHKDFIICTARKKQCHPKVSICIPAFQQPELLRRCLESVRMQSYQDYEVIVTDDSGNDCLQSVIAEFAAILNLKYIKNVQNMGSPANWNHAMQQASGEYIKILHHDDWFFAENSLAGFVEMLECNPKADLVFCPSRHYEKGVHVSTYVPGLTQLNWLAGDPKVLFRGNVIGAPSAVLFRRWGLLFDEKLKWVVDLDFYIRLLSLNKNFVYTPQELICIDLINDTKVTAICENNREIELFENFYFFEKLGIQHFSKELVDFFVRLFLKYDVTSLQEIRECGYEGDLDATFEKILQITQKIKEQVR